MRRLYMMMDDDPNFYLLTVPPTSIRDVNNQLAKIMTGGVPYTGLVLKLTLEKTQNAAGVAYSKVVISKAGLLPPAAANLAQEMRRQIKAQYQSLAITSDDYAATPEQSKAADIPDNDYQEAGASPVSEPVDFQEAARIDEDNLPFN